MFKTLFRKMSSKPNWLVEKERILQLPLEEKRHLYKNHVTLNKVHPWYRYAYENKLEGKHKPTLDDVTEFKKLKIDSCKNKDLADKVSIFKGDITKLEVDAIVNAANSRLRAGGGVDGAIHRAAGPLLQEECDTLGGCPTGEARITGGYNLPAKYVIHTVGPQDGSAKSLKSAYVTSLSLLEKYKLKSIAFPCISTGIYGFPNRQAAHIALSTVRMFLETNPQVENVVFCTFMPVDVEIYECLMQMYFPLHDYKFRYNEGASVSE